MSKSMSLLVLLSVFSMGAQAGPTCTEADRNTWQSEESFQKQLREQGYTIKKFKVTSGNCYEIYGFDKDQRKVEIYFNPVDGRVVKANTKD